MNGLGNTHGLRFKVYRVYSRTVHSLLSNLSQVSLAESGQKDSSLNSSPLLFGHGSIPRVVAGPPPLCYKPLSRRLCFKPLSRGIAGAPPILLTGMLRNSKQADTLRFHEGECAKYRKKMRVQQGCQSEASIVQERGLGFKVKRLRV